MSAATAVAPAMPLPISPVAPVIPPAPTYLPQWQRRAIVHSGELAVTNGLRLIGRGLYTAPEHDGAPLFVVSSASRPGMVHLVWVEGGRIMCDCEARTAHQAFTCAHAQFVRLLIIAERATPASVPPAVVASTPSPSPDLKEPAPESDPDPEPPAPVAPAGPRHRVACPTCGGPTDADEIAQIGECLNCLQMRADLSHLDRAAWDDAEQQLPCWACGEPSTAETIHGLYCDDCVSLATAVLRAKVAARQARIAAAAKAEKAKAEQKAESARRIIDREQAREKAGAPSAASPRATTRATGRAAKTPARATAD